MRKGKINEQKINQVVLYDNWTNYFKTTNVALFDINSLYKLLF